MIEEEGDDWIITKNAQASGKTIFYIINDREIKRASCCHISS
jgi:hypothetical protein